MLNDIDKEVTQVLAENEYLVSEWYNGNEKAYNSLVGQILKRVKGNVNPNHVRAILEVKL